MGLRLHGIYNDRQSKLRSPDPRDPVVTVRVETVMVAAEYQISPTPGFSRALDVAGHGASVRLHLAITS